MMRLYQFEDCPYCGKVRRKMSELLLTYINVNVPTERGLRKEVMEISGQPYVPVLVDGDTILSDEDEIIAYLEKKYGRKATGGRT